MSKQTIETYAPSFSGVYKSIWDHDLDNVIYNINEDRNEKGLDDLSSDVNINIDWTKYKDDVSKSYVNHLATLMNDYVESIEFEGVYSPREYNFSTDSINVKVTIDTTVIAEYVRDNKESFAEYIKERFTSRSGFSSFYSNDVDVWINEYTDGLTDFSKKAVHIGAVLDFIFEDNFNEQEDLYDDVSTEINDDEYITNWDELVN